MDDNYNFGVRGVPDQVLSSYRSISGANVPINSYVQPKVLDAAHEDCLPQTERSGCPDPRPCDDDLQMDSFQIEHPEPASIAAGTKFGNHARQFERQSEKVEHPNASQIV